MASATRALSISLSVKLSRLPSSGQPPDHNHRSKNLNGAIKPKTGESRRSGLQCGNQGDARAPNIPVECHVFEPEFTPKQ